VSDFSDMVVIVMAWRRPYYLRRTLMSWAAVPEVKQIAKFAIGLGEHPKKGENLAVVAEAEEAMGRSIDIWPDSPRAQASPAMHRPMGEAASLAWSHPEVGWVILCEDDSPVSDDVLRYQRWARDTFEGDPRVLLVCSHNIPWVDSGPGVVDGYSLAPSDKVPHPPDEADEDQNAVRLKQGFDSRSWGTWRGRWEQILEPTWDWECNSGGADDSGIDWNIATRVMPRGGYLSVVPDACRCLNIGRDEGVYMIAADKPEGWVSSQSFREHRGDVEYRIVR
jgi:hypothetical protein